MTIQMIFESDEIEFILKHNLSENIRPTIGAGEALLWLAEYPEEIKKEDPTYLWNTGNNVGVNLKLNYNGQKDSLCITVDTIVTLFESDID